MTTRKGKKSFLTDAKDSYADDDGARNVPDLFDLFE